jgi:hypothetical protein
MYRRSGMRDWFDPSCTPGTDPNCVPHWYCYVPFMATPDCRASFGEGLRQIASGVTSTVAGTAGTIAGGIAAGVGQGVCSSILGSGQFGQMVCGSPTTAALIGIGGIAVLALLFSGGRRRR